MLARSGEIPAPCPVPLSLTATIPSSRMPAFSHFWIRRMMRLSPIRCSTKRMSQSLLTSSKKDRMRSEEHTSELQSRQYLVCRLLLEKKNEDALIVPLFSPLKKKLLGFLFLNDPDDGKIPTVE